ncbi:phage tail protein [bacterium]|nr:phage tail protein [bacterium]
MERLKIIKEYLISQGGFKDEDMACHVLESESVPVEQETGTGFHLFDDKYEALIYILDVTQEKYKYLKLLLYEWFRENRVDDEEKFRLSADVITDTFSFVTVSMNLVESVHIAADVEGIVERDGTMHRLSAEPMLTGI